jgi:hypothetical protein
MVWHPCKLWRLQVKYGEPGRKTTMQRPEHHACFNIHAPIEGSATL